ncbi:MAG: YcbK family protein [Deltaproteobacteria bacterium]|nr:YcbK family protein [Deltaproteobacteria bacterium]MBN2671906.1 YcbK family protein [Deltaproteobacteria bacterium]
MIFTRVIAILRRRRIPVALVGSFFCLGVGLTVRAQGDVQVESSDGDSDTSTETDNSQASEPETDKREKEYPQWAVVKRPGVLMPITTLFNLHTRESLPIFEHPSIHPALLQHFFRCRGFGQTTEMAPELIETILSAAKEFKCRRITIISGYRSPKFNDTLAKKGRRVAAESRHMRGQAVDFRADTADASQLGKWLKEHFEGGVGIYKNDNFVHIDVGPKRSWMGH